MWSRFFALFGLVCSLCFAYLVWQRNTPLRLAFDDIQAVSAGGQVGVLPRVISIPDLNLKLPIVALRAEGRAWEATDTGVAYLASSPVPGMPGNSILYGHNWPNLLGNLPRIRPGQAIDITDANGKTQRFIVRFTSVVTPDQTHILSRTADTRITLYTCTGFLDSKRFVVTAIAEI